MRQAFQCHVCGPCWQAHAELDNKPVTDALTHWAFICHHCILWLCVLLPAKTRTFSPKTCQKLAFFFFLKEPCSLDKGRVSLGVLPQGAVSTAATPSMLRGRDVNSGLPHCVHPQMPLRSQSFGPWLPLLCLPGLQQRVSPQSSLSSLSRTTPWSSEAPVGRPPQSESSNGPPLTWSRVGTFTPSHPPGAEIPLPVSPTPTPSPLCVKGLDITCEARRGPACPRFPGKQLSRG